MHLPKPATRTAVTPEAEAAGLPHSHSDSHPAAGAGVGAATGAAAGAAIGAFAGPPGAIAGALIGAAAGAATGAALGSDHDAEDEDKKLDEEIGVTSGDLGAASPNAPRAVRGTYSGASAGAGSTGVDDSAPDEGPMPHGE
jgi:phage tail tape-measure protein